MPQNYTITTPKLVHTPGMFLFIFEAMCCVSAWLLNW